MFFFPNRVTLQYLLAYKKAVDVTYSCTEQISMLVEAAGKRWDIYFWPIYAPKSCLHKRKFMWKSTVEAAVMTFVRVD